MTTIADGLKDVFLAGVGAMALGAEKTQELVEQLIAKGEIRDVVVAYFRIGQFHNHFLSFAAKCELQLRKTLVLAFSPPFL